MIPTGDSEVQLDTAESEVQHDAFSYAFQAYSNPDVLNLYLDMDSSEVTSQPGMHVSRGNLS